MEPMSISFEFRLIDQLDRILENNLYWKLTQATIHDITDYHVMPIEEKIRIMDLRNRLLKDKHKSALGERATILSNKLAK